ncbi:TonB-linked SusC/RagA family outer membrane protein [Chitinophaga niastensis]|uniref:TonB-linked SusC/RagA family outer membrane protein n=1 Tax=Chitinophaga niastensis TaxID=536980 RepID=A0A2P8HA59_CHINA|nr:TonB-dependent receptor [Chitinophaga niastensis]PSL43081.1 TonB-linked SusC/RagA family outer membrane protein [Chitinophaga niastensis]
MLLIIRGKVCPLCRLLPVKMLGTMKFAAILLAGIFFVNAKSFSQNVTISGKDLTCKQIFATIEQQTSFAVVCDNSLLSRIKPVSINVKNISVSEILDRCLKGTGLTWSIRNNVIVIKKEDGNHSPKEQMIPQEIISGIVRDENGTDIEGASVFIKGNDVQKGIVTNAKGEFSLENIPPGSYTLEISIIGYNKYEKKITVNGPVSRLAVTLLPSVNSLTETVVVAYGTQKKTDLTGAVSSISANDLNNRPVTNVTNALQGTMAGVIVVENNGQPGRDEGTINIRGIGTLGKLDNSAPMVVVDGLISSLKDVNPNDIEHISVLKDAASAAIYGSRAANGVVVITTKRGQKGHLQVHYDAYAGKQKAIRLPDYLPSWQQATLYNEALKNEGAYVRWTNTDIRQFKDGSDLTGAHPDTDWLRKFYAGSGVQQNHYLSLTGGDDKAQYLFSLGYFDQNGIVPHTDNKKYSTRFNINAALSPKFSINANLGYIYAPFEEPASAYFGVPAFSEMISQIYRVSNTVPYKYANGYYGYVGDGNPMAWLESGSLNKARNHTLAGNVNADWEFVKGLHFKPNFGYRLNMIQGELFVKDIQFYDYLTGAPTKYQGPNNLTNTAESATYTNLQALLEYQKDIALHHFKLLAGYSQEYQRYTSDTLYRQGFLNNIITQINAGPAAGQTNAGSANELALQSVFGRLNYDYNEKYLLEANLRYDGSSRFAPANRWGLFPSFSAGWNIAGEDFFEKMQSIINSLKLRGSWGMLGNQAVVGNYPAIATVSPGLNYSFGQAIAAGIAPVVGANPNITWEATTTYDVGLDATFLKNKLTVTADYFVKNTNNVLLQLPIGAPYSLTAPYQNAGAVTNKGWEFAIGYRNRVHEFSYYVNMNAAFIKNEITDLKGSGPYINAGTFQQVGYPVNSLYGYISEGIFQTKDEIAKHATQRGGVIAPGDIMYKDINNDGVIDGKDRVYLGSYFPKMTYGLNGGISWKGVDVNFFFQGALGVKNYVQANMLGEVGANVNKPTTIFLDRWTPANPTATFPRLWISYTNNDPARTPSSFWVKNASYLRLKNLQIGYNIPDVLTQKIGIRHFKIYYSGQNIWTISKFYKWVDPEAPVGESGYTYPQVLINTIGVNVTF